MSKESEYVLKEHEVGGIIATWNRTSNSRYELCRAVESEVISRCRAQGGNTIDNINQAAANKAAEEGGLPEMPEKSVIDKHIPTGIVFRGHTDKAMKEYALKAIAADRASRQVANKAEVDLLESERRIESLELELSNQREFTQHWKMKALFPPAPPATTGASTVLTDERIDAVIERINPDAHYVSAREIVREALREVAAQAGQVAVLDGFCEPCQGFGELHGEVCPHCSDNTWQAAPSPAKESK